MRTVQVLLVYLLVSSSAASGQSSWNAVEVLNPGSAVRILQTGGRVVSGKFRSADDAEITLLVRDKVTYVPRLGIQQVEFLESNIRRRTLEGVACGAGLGAVGAFGASLGGANPAVPAVIFSLVGSLVGRLSAQSKFAVVFLNRVP